MSGTFSFGGLITGLNSNQLIEQLLQIERQPIIRIQERIATLQAQQTSIRDLRTQLLTLRTRVQEFQLDDVLSQFEATSSSTAVLTSAVTGENPVSGSFIVNVTQLASATSASSSSRLGAAINPDVALASSGISESVSAGQFTINGVAFTVNPATQTLNQVLGQINSSAAGVTATYNAGTDTVTIENSTAGDTSIINFGGTGDTSSFLQSLRLIGATQSTGVNGATTVSSTRNLGAVSPGAALNTVNFAGGAATSGSFSINGVSINVDVTTDSLSDVIARVNSSGAGVTASYDTATDMIRVVSNQLGSRTIRFTAGSSNILNVTNLTTAVQQTGTDSQFQVNGGPVQTRNSNQITDAIGGVTLTLLSTGTSTVTVATDEEGIVEGVQAFIDAFNESVGRINRLTETGGVLQNDNTLKILENFLRGTIFSTVPGAGSAYQSLADIGISTGTQFVQDALPQLSLDADAFLEALAANSENVKALFSNDSDTGIANQLFDYLDSITGINGFLNDRARANGTIDDQIRMMNDRIVRLEGRLEQRERRLRLQFTRLEQLSASLRQQNNSLAGLQNLQGVGSFR